MATSKLIIRFNQDLNIGAQVSFNLKRISTGIETPLIFTWVDNRSSAYEVTRLPYISGKIGKSSALAFINSFEIDQPSFDISLIAENRIGSEIQISTQNEDITFTGGVATSSPGIPAFVSFSITRIEGIEISGLESDNYLINNDIYLGINNIETITNYRISFNNLNNAKSTNSFIIYTYNNSANVNITPIVKSLFDYPNVRNQNRIEINIQSYNGNRLVDSSVIVKNFIRGGNRTELTNQNFPLGKILRPSTKLPIWDGYPTDEYFLDTDGTIQIRPFAEINPALRDYKRVKGCNNLYFRFLNQQGGYSNWLFESNSNIEKNANLGAYVRDNNIEDLGNEADNSLSVYSKIPAEYIGLIKDLFISPEIYIWKDLRWVRVFSGKNTSDEDTAKRAYSIKAKFDIENRFNPSLLWSN